MDNARDMEPGELVAWRRTYLVSQTQLADLVGVHKDTVKRWESGETRIPKMLPLALETVAGQREKLIKYLRANKRQLLREARAARLVAAARERGVA